MNRKRLSNQTLSSVPRRASGLGAIGKNLSPKTPGEALSSVELAARKIAGPADKSAQTISRCNKRYEEHLENVRNGVREGAFDEHEVISAILDFPLAELSHSLIVGDGQSEALEMLMNGTNNERIREHAREKLDLAIAFIDAIF